MNSQTCCFSEADERIERASLSDEERTILAMDLYGNGCQPTLETPEMLAKAMQEVHKILESALASRKLVCETALSPVSEAVGKEMDWLAFLRAEKYVCQVQKQVFVLIRPRLPQTRAHSLRSTLFYHTGYSCSHCWVLGLEMQAAGRSRHSASPRLHGCRRDYANEARTGPSSAQR
jgi:hypothetical protein